MHESGNIGKTLLFPRLIPVSFFILPVKKVWRGAALHIAVIDVRSISFSHPNALCCSVAQVICQSYLLMKQFDAVAEMMCFSSCDPMKNVHMIQRAESAVKSPTKTTEL